MKTAILLATRKDDPLDVKVVRHGVYSEVLADFKTRVAEGRGESGYDSLEIWSGPPVKKHSRLSSPAPSAPPVEEVPAVPSLLDGAGGGADPEQPEQESGESDPSEELVESGEGPELPLDEPAADASTPDASTPGSMTPRRRR